MQKPFNPFHWAANNPLLGAITYNIMFGFAYLPLKMLTELLHGNTEQIIALRFGLAVLIMLLLRGAKVVDFRPITTFGIGVFPISAIQLLSGLAETNGLKGFPTGKASVIMALGPLVSTIFSVFIFRERPRFWQWIAMVISLCGIFLVNSGGADTETTFIGFLWVLLATLLSSVLNLLLRKNAVAATSIELTYAMSLTSMVVYGGTSLFHFAKAGTPLLFFAPIFHPQVFGCLLYLAFFSSIYANGLRNIVFAKLPVSIAVSFSGISTITAVLVGIAIRHEPFGVVEIVGIIFVLLGVWGVNYFRPHSPPKHKNF